MVSGHCPTIRIAIVQGALIQFDHHRGLTNRVSRSCHLRSPSSNSKSWSSWVTSNQRLEQSRRSLAVRLGDSILRVSVVATIRHNSNLALIACTFNRLMISSTSAFTLAFQLRATLLAPGSPRSETLENTIWALAPSRCDGSHSSAIAARGPTSSALPR